MNGGSNELMLAIEKLCETLTFMFIFFLNLILTLLSKINKMNIQFLFIKFCPVFLLNKYTASYIKKDVPVFLSFHFNELIKCLTYVYKLSLI